MNQTERILVVGSSGQIGTELVVALRKIYGGSNVIASDIQALSNVSNQDGPYEVLNILDGKKLAEIVEKYKVTQIYLLAAMLSAAAEKNPVPAWELNMNGLFNVLNLAKEKIIKKVYWPSSIAVFGATTPKQNTPQITVAEPHTVYGISKLAGERWCEYYFNKYSVDVRSIRYPGIIGYKSLPGGGTTDYAVHIFYDAITQGNYECFLNKDTTLPMIYMSDAIKATLMLMESEADKIKIRSSYNIASVSFSPEKIAAEITKHISDFKISYRPDFRQTIAEGWPKSIDDTPARQHWGWKPDYDLSEMTNDMLKNLSVLLKKENVVFN